MLATSDQLYNDIISTRTTKHQKSVLSSFSGHKSPQCRKKCVDALEQFDEQIMELKKKKLFRLICLLNLLSAIYLQMLCNKCYQNEEKM